MYIANPIYDVVFKYLMEDSKLAKLMLSSIIGEEILELEFLTQEFAGEFQQKRRKLRTEEERKELMALNIEERFSLTVYRLDFSAKIKTPEGKKQVIIELQKAKYPTDIMRFRNYLASQLKNKDNTTRVLVNGKQRKVGIPLISVYFLGHNLDHTKASAIKVSREYRDLITNEIITTKEHFIESLTLDSYIIQIPTLKTQRRTELETLLSVFDQSQAIDAERHILNLNEADFPEKFHPIIRKLHKAVQTQEIKKQMDMEDNVIDEFEELERQIEMLEERSLTAEKQKVKVEQEKYQIEQEKHQIEQEKHQIEQEKHQIEQEKHQIEQENQAVKQKLESIEGEMEKLKRLIEEMQKLK